ncbi:MAG: heat-inducible transcriptional repressor HrcA [Rhodospirillaceae bacterium]|nr:heat-inducible transcriptional repressor HrcA [Rhodospirillaceae bacterium]MDD9917663.1 heat-inducible transcriptional repressor HrcA [Rhodospirillaceae bacterium]MDD9929789.1 heat-inducible transcriptional repressor HrcA [Rhodospirillaceae bacterium]
MVPDLNERSREVLRLVVEAYVETGEPIGSRSLSRKLGMSLSPATIRNVMADLEETGLLYAPHTSAGRLPTDAGLQLFVDGILEIGNLTETDRKNIEAQCAASGRTLNQVLEETSSLLSGLSHCAGLVVAPKKEAPLKHIEFVSLGPGRALVVIVNQDGLVENRVIDLPLGMPASSLIEASNFFSAHVAGRTLGEAQERVRTQIAAERAELDQLSRSVVEAGLATWSNAGIGDDVLIVRGQANLLEDVTGMADLERIRALFQKLETNEALLSLIEATEGAEGVQIFIGADNELFSLAGCSVIIAPFSNSEEKIVGAIGVVGPARMNYGRIIPMVDYTAKIVGRVIG